MILTGRQFDSFRADSLRKFEDEMIAHVQRYFLNHYKALGEPALRKAIRYGYARARRYGMSSIRNVCMYLNNMILLGSNFDLDPQYPWTAELLAEKARTPEARMDEMSDRTLKFIGEIGGPNNLYIFRTLLNLVNNSEAIYQQVQVESPHELVDVFRTLYPQKAAAVGNDNLRQMISKGIRDAGKYDITNWPALGVYALFMFTMGSGFDEDPQFPWAVEILKDAALNDETVKTERLYRSAVKQLKTAVDQYEK